MLKYLKDKLFKTPTEYKIGDKFKYKQEYIDDYTERQLKFNPFYEDTNYYFSRTYEVVEIKSGYLKLLDGSQLYLIVNMLDSPRMFVKIN